MFDYIPLVEFFFFFFFKLPLYFTFFKRVNDRIIRANDITLECVDYSIAVQVLRECGNTVNLLIKRRVLFPPYDIIKVNLTKSRRKDGNC